MRDIFPCDFNKACQILFAVKRLGWSLTKASIFLKVNLGTVSKVVNGRVHPDASPTPFSDDEAA